MGRPFQNSAGPRGAGVPPVSIASTSWFSAVSDPQPRARLIELVHLNVPGTLLQTRDLVRRTSNRARLCGTLDRAVAGAVFGAAIGLAAIVLGKLMPLPWAWWWNMAACPAACAAVGALSALLGRWTPLRSARELEARLALNDRLSSALVLAKVSPSDPFVRVAMDQADHLSGQIDPAGVFPIRARRWWLAGPALAAAGIAAGLWMPTRGPGAAGQDTPAAARAREDAADDVAELRAAMSESTPANIPAASAREIAELDDIQRELAQGRLSPGEAASRSARAAERAAQRSEERGREEIEEFDRTRQGLAGAARSEPARVDAGGERDASDFRRALGAGDVAGAARAIDRAERDAGSMTPEQRRALAKDLEELGRSLEPRDDPGSPPAPGPLPGLLRDAARELSGPPPKGSKAPKDRGNPPANSEPASQDSGSKDLGSKDPIDDGPTAVPPPRAESEPKGGDPGGQGRTDRGSSEREPSDERDDGAGDEPRESTREKLGDPTPNDDGEGTPANKRADNPTVNSPGSTTPAPDQSQPKNSGDADLSGKDQPKGSNPPPAPSRPSAAGDVQKRPDSRSGKDRASDAAAREQKGPSSGEPARPGGSAMERLAKELRDLGSTPDRARTNAQNARELRERARRMLENASPEQRRELGRLAREMQDPSPPHNPGSTPAGQPTPGSGQGAAGEADQPDSNGRDGAGRGTNGTRSPSDRDTKPRTNPAERPGPSIGSKTQPLDARPKQTDTASKEPETVISSWSAPPEPDGAARSSGGSLVAERFRSAAAGAERSVEQQAVPTRYGDLVRRVFRRYVERTSQKAESPGQPAPAISPDAPDVPRPK